MNIPNRSYPIGPTCRFTKSKDGMHNLLKPLGRSKYFPQNNVILFKLKPNFKRQISQNSIPTLIIN